LPTNCLHTFRFAPEHVHMPHCHSSHPLDSYQPSPCLSTCYCTSRRDKATHCSGCKSRVTATGWVARALKASER
jgi:hypothetical protein